ncbi:MAG: hypothetical protein V1822_03995 [Candidatus Micrarchaeota archaeon]
MVSTVINYEGAVEESLKRLMEMGIFKSKSDAFRVGVVELAAKYGAVKTKEEVIDEMMYKDALPAINKVRAKKAKLYNLDEME